MRKQILTTIAMLPLLLSCRGRRKDWTVDRAALRHSQRRFGHKLLSWRRYRRYHYRPAGALKLKEEQGRRSDDGRSGCPGREGRDQGARRHSDDERDDRREQDRNCSG